MADLTVDTAGTMVYNGNTEGIMTDKIEYWLGLCDDNLITAKWLLEGKRYLDAAYFCHQIAEKALKASVAFVTAEIPPKIHDLKKLAVKGGVFDDLSQRQQAYLINLEPFQIEARYPDYKEGVSKTLNDEKTKKILTETEEFLCWIKQRLGK